MEILLLLFVVALYFLPTIVGYGKRNAGAICVLNLFLGWTFIGWVIALVWAATDEAPRYTVPPVYDPAPPGQPTTVDQIIKLTSLREKGIISEAEYEREKQKILHP